MVKLIRTINNQPKTIKASKKKGPPSPQLMGPTTNLSMESLQLTIKIKKISQPLESSQNLELLRKLM